MGGPDFSRYDLILHDEFDGELNSYDGTSGLWSTRSARDNLVTNGYQSVFLDGTEMTSAGEPVGIDPVWTENGRLTIDAGVLAPDELARVRDVLHQTGEDNFADKTKYYTGRVTTGETWAQTYGYFEIVARVPEGKGHWSAFWLSPGDAGWPPEIDIFEAYGRGVHDSTPKDYVYNVAVFFDEIDVNGEATQSADIVNPYHLDAEGNPQLPDYRSVAGRDIAVFHENQNTMEQFGADIYSDFYTYAVEWTPEEIIFYFGEDRDSLVEVYRTPTPDDLHSPMVTIGNDQISSRWGWNPVEGYDHLTFADDNRLQIESISIYALAPEEITGERPGGGTILGDDTHSTLTGTAGDDRILPGDGLDFVDLGGGADVVFVSRDVENTVLSSFGADDRLVLDGFNIENAADALARLTQVGDDVWLPNGAYPKDPQTVVFRDTTVEAFAAENFVVRWSETPDVWASRLRDYTRTGDADGDGMVVARSGGSRLDDVSGFRGPMSLYGSDAGDVYFVYRTTTRIVEAEDGGVDTVQAVRSFTLPDNVENITPHGTRSGLTLTGNDADNRMIANAADNVFAGAGGNDLYDLSAGGADTIVVRPGDGHDAVIGFGDDDAIVLDGFAFPSEAAFLERVHTVGRDVVIDLGSGQSIAVREGDPATVAAAVSFDAGESTLAGSSLMEGYHDPAVPLAAGPADEPLGERAILGRGEDDLLLGDAGGNHIRASNGADTVHGGAGSDTINGGNGDDLIFGGADDDFIAGSDGDDAIYGGGGDDRMFGGDGRDAFHFLSDLERDQDIINDFGDDDTIVIHDRTVSAIEDTGNSATIVLSDGDEIILRHLSAADVGAHDIVLL